MNPEDRVDQQFAAHIEHAVQSANMLGPSISHAADLLVQTLIQGGKILCCGNGGSSTIAQHFATNMINRFERERPGLPAIALSATNSSMTSTNNGHSYDAIFSRQLSVLGRPGDLFLAISTSGNSDNLCHAVEAAEERQMPVVAINGGEGGKLSNMLREQDIEIRIPGVHIARIQEIQLFIVHCLCDLIDAQLLGD